MSINIYKNKGMYVEDLINRTCQYYLDNDMAFISKRFLPIKIISKKSNKINGILLEKSTVDYNGIYNGKYIDFEAKETNKDFFNLSNIKKHQINHLFEIKKFNGISFIIIGFISVEDHFFILTCNDIVNFKNKKINKLNLEYCYKNLFNLKIIFPGILDIISFININNNKYVI